MAATDVIESWNVVRARYSPVRHVLSGVSQETGRQDRPQNDQPFPVEWDVEPLDNFHPEKSLSKVAFENRSLPKEDCPRWKVSCKGQSFDGDFRKETLQCEGGSTRRRRPVRHVVHFGGR